MPASSGKVLSTKVKKRTLLSFLDKNSQFFHACQLRGMVLSMKK